MEGRTESATKQATSSTGATFSSATTNAARSNPTRRGTDKSRTNIRRVCRSGRQQGRSIQGISATIMPPANKKAGSNHPVRHPPTKTHGHDRHQKHRNGGTPAAPCPSLDFNMRYAQHTSIRTGCTSPTIPIHYRKTTTIPPTTVSLLLLSIVRTREHTKRQTTGTQTGFPKRGARSKHTRSTRQSNASYIVKSSRRLHDILTSNATDTERLLTQVG